MRGGRGGRGGSVSLTQDLYRNNLEDMGMEQGYNNKFMGASAPPPLYPPIELETPPSSLTNDESFCAQKARTITAVCQSSSFYLKRKKESTDIARYSDKYKRDKILTMDEYIQDSYQKDPESSGNKHFPPELYSEKKVGLARCRTTSSTKQYRKNKHMLKLQDLADKEGARRGRANSTASAGSDEDDEEGEGGEEEDAEGGDADDYGVDHYASDDGGGDDDDAGGADDYY